MRAVTAVPSRPSPGRLRVRPETTDGPPRSVQRSFRHLAEGRIPDPDRTRPNDEYPARKFRSQVARWRRRPDPFLFPSVDVSIEEKRRGTGLKSQSPPPPPPPRDPPAPRD